ncbi:MAG: divalent-cation tolerance protein CutA [Gammaproteobacteria bacterium]|nr:divalent-cation tolerance protein CutA [Gammaproteobacteria bacterium]MDH3767590.1 divalent-cation tolerance protein CutA [Gammaproteobacteria bacterium]
MSAPDDTLLVYCTCPDAPTASRLAAELVERQLAACVSQLSGLVSTYRWENQMKRDEETLLIIKTTSGAYSSLESTLRRLHPYELPEIVAVTVSAGLPGYLAWVAENVAK